MKKILLSFPYNLDDKKNQYEKILNSFQENDYHIHNFEGINNNDFNIEILINILNMIEQEYKGIKKIVIISNIRELIFIWYRIYNHIIDDFVYFVDDRNINFLQRDENYSFLKELSNFSSIKKESLNSRIYLNLSLDNYLSITNFILKSDSIEYFDNIKNFNYNKKRSFIEKNKIYKYGNYNYSFFYNNLEKEVVNIYKKNINILDENIFEKLKNNLYILVFFSLLISKNNKVKNNIFLIKLFRYLKENICEKEKNFIENEVLKTIKKKYIGYRTKIFFLTLLINLGITDEYILKDILRYTINDKKYKNYHYSIFYNSYLYPLHRGLSVYEEFYYDEERLLEKLKSYYIENEKIVVEKRPIKSKKYKIILYLNQLLSINHSPTKLALDFINRLYKYDESVELMIISEDSYTLNKNEIMISDFFLAPNSSDFKDIHYNYLDNKIDIYYSNTKASFGKRIKDIVEKIKKFNPNIIYSWSNFSVPLSILKDHYTMIYRSMGGMPINDYSHYILYKSLLRDINDHLKQKILGNYSLINLSVTLSNSKKEYKRKDYKIRKKDFVLITVGNRLNVELSKEYIDIIISYLVNQEDIKWIIVGVKTIDYIVKKYKNLIDNKIIFIKYENDLLSLYRICDIYINPIRKGGGISSAMAMKAGLPIVTTKTSSDVVEWYGEENAVDNLKDYIDEINKLRYNLEYFNTKKRNAIKRINFFENIMNNKELEEIMKIFKKFSDK